MASVLFSSQHFCEISQILLMIFGFVLVFLKTDEEIEAQWGEVTCSESHSGSVVGLELELRNKEALLFLGF